MTLEDWLAAKSAGPLSFELSTFPDRKIHLLTAAFLRRVEPLLSHYTRVAVEATERFADRRMTKVALARLRVADTLETCDPIWLSADPSWPAGSWLSAWDYWRDEVFAIYEQQAVERERRIANGGYLLHCVRAGIDWPHWVAAKAAFLARDLCRWVASVEERDTVVAPEAAAQFALFREIGGDGSRPDLRWPQWRTSDVLAMARGVHRDRAYDRLPILADALQDAGCDDAAVLDHCRRPGGHVRGCWVVDLAMGIG